MSVRALRVRLREAYWAVPAVLTGGCGAAAFALIALDRRLQREGVAFAFTGGPDSARSILDAIASSMLTLTALVFSITVIVLQLASTQFSPRVLRTFLSDRQNQVTLGVFTGTFIYALVTLRAVRGSDGLVDLFVPGVAITVAFVLVLLSIGLFVAYIQHITQSIRVATIVDRISEETDDEIRRLPAEELEATVPRPPPAESPVTVTAPRRGTVLAVDHRQLARRASADGTWIEVAVRIGDFVPEGAVLALVHGEGPDPGPVAAAFVQGVERSIEGDVTFGFRQLVDIAARALSPGINDPSTAVQCLDQLHHLLRQLAVRPPLLGQEHDGDGALRVVYPVPTWDEVLGLALDEIRNVGADSLQVQRRVEAILRDLLRVVDDSRRTSVERQLELLLRRRALDLPPVERPLDGVSRPDLQFAGEGTPGDAP